MKPPIPSLSLVLPARDEAKNIAAVLARAFEVLPRLAKEFEVIVVDDGSRDATGSIATQFDGVRVLHHAESRGYGAALRSGLRAARLEWVFFTDADLQFDLAELSALIVASDRGGRVTQPDVVAGYRVRRRDPWTRRALAWGWGRLVRLVYGLRVRDVDCAFKLFRRDVLDAISIESVGAFVNTEILVRAQAAGFRIQEVPVSHYPRTAGTASGAHPRVILRALHELLRMRRRLP